MSREQFLADVSEMFESKQMKPRRQEFCIKDSKDNLCGCAIGAAVIKTGGVDERTESFVDTVKYRYQLSDDYAWGVIEGFDGVNVSRMKQDKNSDAELGYEDGKSLWAKFGVNA